MTDKTARLFHDRTGRLRQRERRRLSRQMLADLCGLSRNVIAQYERGKRFPSIGNLIVLADFFDTSIDDLVGRK